MRGDETAIESRDNQLLKLARAVRDGRERELIFVEGVRLAEEALGAGLALEAVLYTPETTTDERGDRLIAELRRKARRAHPVSERLLAAVSDTKTPQGVILLASRPAADDAAFDQLSGTTAGAPLLVILHGVNNPANAGSIIRVAEAAGASGVMTTRGTTDLFSPKALRGAMGSSFRLPIRERAAYTELLAWMRARGIRAICAAAGARTAHTEIDWTGPSALILGEEGRGLTGAEVALADASIRIPMRAPVESLNVAVASGIVLYEAARQRGAA